MISNDSVLVIFDYLHKITDKRSLSRTCKTYNILLKDPVIKYQKKYFIWYRTLNHTELNPNTFLTISTYEFCKDGYFDKIPDSYYRKDNIVLCKELIPSGNIELLKRAMNANCTLHMSTCAIAAQYGYLDIIQLGKENDCIWDDGIIKNAANHGHLNVLVWIYKNNYWGTYDSISYDAAYSGHVHILQWIDTVNKHFITPTTSYVAAVGKQINVLDWLKKKGYLMSNGIVKYALDDNNVDILKWWVKNEGQLSYNDYAYGLSNGNEGMVAWLKEKYGNTSYL